MFSMRFWDLFGSDGVSCVKLPAAVAFPTDDRLLRRIEESRRALPANNMKPLWKSREPASPPEATCALRGPDVEKHVERIQRYHDAGFDHLVLVQIGRDQKGFFEFFRQELEPALRRALD